jgi:hypothetical protein
MARDKCLVTFQVFASGAGDAAFGMFLGFAALAIAHGLDDGTDDGLHGAGMEHGAAIGGANRADYFVDLNVHGVSLKNLSSDG